MPTLYLARHGQDGDNAAGILNGRRDMPLTAIGVYQADQLAQKIRGAGIRFDRAYCSPLQRAYQTATIVTTALEVDLPEKLDLLTERDFGVMSGKPAKEIEALCAPDILKTETITYFLSPEGAETFPELLGRAQKLLDMLRAGHRDETLLLVTHGDFGKMLYAAFYGLEWQEVLMLFHFGNSELLLLAEGTKPAKRRVFGMQQFNQ
jgi:probable phosphoglycerate mutase